MKNVKEEVRDKTVFWKWFSGLFLKLINDIIKDKVAILMPLLFVGMLFFASVSIISFTQVKLFMSLIFFMFFITSFIGVFYLYWIDVIKPKEKTK